MLSGGAMRAATLAVVALALSTVRGESRAAADVHQPPTPGVANCSELFFEQTLDHFNWNGVNVQTPDQTTFKQRYFVNTQYWRNTTVNGTTRRGPIFFYFGNEDNVELYVNHTGLMWESAEEFGAALVFAEHRFYGESLPFPAGTPNCLGWLTTEQAMADFATLISYFKSTMHAETAPVIGFGGSYGGMIGAWFRLKYPNMVDGVIAASAPIWSFLGLSPSYNPASYYMGVNFDVTSAGGSAEHCEANLKSLWPKLINAANSSAGRKLISESFRLCSPMQAADEVYGLIDWINSPWALMAMGNYPYPCSYIMHGLSDLPAFPVRVACSFLASDTLSTEDLFEAVRKSVAVVKNNTGTEKCFDALRSYRDGEPAGPGRTMRSYHRRFQNQIAVDARIARRSNNSIEDDWSSCAGNWQYQWCTEMTQPFTSGCDGTDFMYPCSRFNLESSIASCQTYTNVTPRAYWVSEGLGGKRGFLSASNIVFSNGRLDPWHAGGVLESLSDSVIALVIDDSAHHLDLMFSNPADPESVIKARATERKEMHKWVAQAYSRNLI